MAIRHWHPAKIGIIWLLDLALLGLLWEPRRSSHTEEILLWLVLSIPAIVVTWRWASAREKRCGGLVESEETPSEVKGDKKPIMKREPHPAMRRPSVLAWIRTFLLQRGGDFKRLFNAIGEALLRPLEDPDSYTHEGGLLKKAWGVFRVLLAVALATMFALGSMVVVGAIFVLLVFLPAVYLIRWFLHDWVPDQYLLAVIAGIFVAGFLVLVLLEVLKAAVRRSSERPKS